MRRRWARDRLARRRLADLAGEDGLFQILVLGPVKGSFAVERLVQGDAKAVLVGASVGLLVEMLLGAHVGRRADHGAREGQRRVEQTRIRGPRQRVGLGSAIPIGLLPWIGLKVGRPCEPEVEHADAPLVGHEDVGRLEVAVHQPRLVGGRKSAPRLHEHVEDLGGVACPLLEPLLERNPVEELGRHVHALVHGAHVEHRDHVGVVELRDGLRLSQQPRAPLGLRLLGLRNGVQELERDLAVEHRIVGFVDDAHAAPNPGAAGPRSGRSSWGFARPVPRSPVRRRRRCAGSRPDRARSPARARAIRSNRTPSRSLSQPSGVNAWWRPGTLRRGWGRARRASGTRHCSMV